MALPGRPPGWPGGCFLRDSPGLSPHPEVVRNHRNRAHHEQVRTHHRRRPRRPHRCARIARRSDYKPVVIESLDDVGGISRTINHNGNRMDIGGHRFFSKSDWVMDWWRGILPVAPEKTKEGLSVIPTADERLLVRPRLSRIYFLRKFFDYPISLSANTMRNLGAIRIVKIGVSYLLCLAVPAQPRTQPRRLLRQSIRQENCIAPSSRTTRRRCGVSLVERSVPNGAPNASRVCRS